MDVWIIVCRVENLCCSCCRSGDFLNYVTVQTLNMRDLHVVKYRESSMHELCRWCTCTKICICILILLFFVYKYTCTYTHTCIHPSIYTCIRTYIHSHIHTFIHTMHTHMPTYLHKYVHTFIVPYLHLLHYNYLFSCPLHVCGCARCLFLRMLQCRSMLL